ncbi:MAG: hypothetical protein H8E48_13135 [Chloroflexi bacterium]|nr:hypothetical protein [Chloroflexota bacterium]
MAACTSSGMEAPTELLAATGAPAATLAPEKVASATQLPITLESTQGPILAASEVGLFLAVHGGSSSDVLKTVITDPSGGGGTRFIPWNGTPRPWFFICR